MGALWLASLLAGKEPLSMRYMKWNFDRRLWRFSLFRYIHAAISLVWGWQAILGATLGGVGVVFPAVAGVFTVLRYLTLVPAYAFTGAYPKAGLQKPPKDTDLALGRLGWVCAASLVIIVAELVFTLFLRS